MNIFNRLTQMSLYIKIYREVLDPFDGEKFRGMNAKWSFFADADIEKFVISMYSDKTCILTKNIYDVSF